MQDTDVNFLSFADVDGRVLEHVRLDPTAEEHAANDFDDTLKLSHVRNFIGRHLWVRGGSENAIDMNRQCANVRIEDASLISGDQCAIVVKGGCEDIALARIIVWPGAKPTPYDIELGGWSDQSFAKTRRVTLADVRGLGDKQVRVAVGRAERPTIVGGNVRVLFWWSVALKVFWVWRRVRRMAESNKGQVTK